MHIVLVGAGRLGVSLAQWLVAGGHEIAVVDVNPSRCSVLDQALGSVSVTGPGTDAGVLGKAGANRADVFMATTGRDDVNLAACQLAKHHFGVPRTISLVNTRDHTDLFKLLGIDITIDVTELVLSRVHQEGLSSHGLVHLMPLSGRDGKNLVAIKIPPNSATEGRSIKDIPLPDGTVISLVMNKEGGASVPGESTLIQPGDDVIAVTTSDDEDELRDLLIEGAEE